MPSFRSLISISSIYKLLLSLFCSLGLFYQCSQLLIEYFSGKTVVNIEVKRELYDNLAAITVCFPSILSMESVGTYDKQYLENYEYYQKLINKYYKNSTIYYEIESDIKMAYKKVDLILEQILYEPDFLTMVIDNLSIPFSKDSQVLIIHGTLPGKYTYIE